MLPNWLIALLMLLALPGALMLAVAIWVIVLMLLDAHRQKRERTDDYAGLHESLLRHAKALEVTMDNG
jgi:hypothetical protein